MKKCNLLYVFGFILVCGFIAFSLVGCLSFEFEIPLFDDGTSQTSNPGPDYNRDFVEMVFVESGKNRSGSVSSGFYIGKYEITQWEFAEIMGFNPSYFQKGAFYPVESVTWYDAIMFCNKLSEKQGYEPVYVILNIKYEGNHIVSATVSENQLANGYRLPTQEEWKFASAGGVKQKTSNTVVVIEFKRLHCIMIILDFTQWKQVLN